MGKQWVRVVHTVSYDKDGVAEIAYPGDWVEIGKHQARRWLAQGRVEIPRPDRREAFVDFERSGVVVRSESQPSLLGFGDLSTRLPFVFGPLQDIPFEFTMIWEPSLSVTSRGVEVGLSRCRESGSEGWELLAMLVDEMTMAADVGGEEERARSELVIHDLRVPVYEPRLIWVHKSLATERFVQAWASELGEGAEEHHAFLRALYQSGVVVRALPSNWQALQASWMPRYG